MIGWKERKAPVNQRITGAKLSEKQFSKKDYLLIKLYSLIIFTWRRNRLLHILCL